MSLDLFSFVAGGGEKTDACTGIGPKVTQSVITAAFLFAFKDALYDMSVQFRRKVPAKLPLK